MTLGRDGGLLGVFRVKYDGEGEVKKFKGRLVAQGYSQKYGYSLLNSHLKMVHQMDVTAFLNGDLKEDIYMQQPPGYVSPGKELYGLTHVKSSATA